MTHDPVTRSSERVAHGDGSPVHVRLVPVELQHLFDGQILRCKCLVDLKRETFACNVCSSILKLGMMAGR